jgi:hypothetical protein
VTAKSAWIDGHDPACRTCLTYLMLRLDLSLRRPFLLVENPARSWVCSQLMHTHRGALVAYSISQSYYGTYYGNGVSSGLRRKMR